MNLPKIHSISKKILVALLGAFLSIFLLFHASANLCILRNDGGAWYNAFCDFMGTNYIIKVFEIILLGAFLLHIALTLWLAITNKMARPKGYHKAQRSKTHTGSKLQVWTGILLLACLLLHFTDFLFVKYGLTKGLYMVKTDSLILDKNWEEKLSQLNPKTIDKYMWYFEVTTPDENGMVCDINIPQAVHKEMNSDPELKKALHALWSLKNIPTSQDGKWAYIQNESQRNEIQTLYPKADFSPDFYHQALAKFQIPHIAISYLIFFVIVWFHLRHGFAAMFQTLGLYNYKYGKAIEIIGIIYATVICLMFASVVIGVYLI